MDKKAKNAIQNLDNLMEFNYNFFEFGNDKSLMKDYESKI